MVCLEQNLPAEMILRASKSVIAHDFRATLLSRRIAHLPRHQMGGFVSSAAIKWEISLLTRTPQGIWDRHHRGRSAGVFSL